MFLSLGKHVQSYELKKVIQIAGAPAPIGPYSQAVLKENTLYVSGQIPMNPLNGELVTGDIRVQTKAVLNNIKNLVEAASLKMDDIVKCSIFILDMNDFSEINEVYADYFGEQPPARETVQVSGLPKNVSIEISCIAIR